MPIKLKGATSGDVTLDVPAVAGTNTLTLPAKTGNLITSADTGTVTQAMLSTGAPSWDSSGNLSFNSGYGSSATAYACRAWVNFNGTGTVAIRASGKVSSITDNGKGTYTINLTNALPDENYSVVGTCSNNDNNRNESGTLSYGSSTTWTTTAFQVWTAENTGTDTFDIDPPRVCVAVFR